MPADQDRGGDEIELSEEDEKALDRAWDKIAGTSSFNARLSTLERHDNDIREHARDGIEFREDVADQLLEANLCRKPAEQVLYVLKAATSYEDAKRKLAAALPDLDRKRLRDMLSGGLLLTQAAGMLTGGREVGASEEKGKRS